MSDVGANDLSGRLQLHKRNHFYHGGALGSVYNDAFYESRHRGRRMKTSCAGWLRSDHRIDRAIEKYRFIFIEYFRAC